MARNRGRNKPTSTQSARGGHLPAATSSSRDQSANRSTSWVSLRNQSNPSSTTVRRGNPAHRGAPAARGAPLPRFAPTASRAHGSNSSAASHTSETSEESSDSYNWPVLGKSVGSQLAGRFSVSEFNLADGDTQPAARRGLNSDFFEMGEMLVKRLDELKRKKGPLYNELNILEDKIERTNRDLEKFNMVASKKGLVRDEYGFLQPAQPAVSRQPLSKISLEEYRRRRANVACATVQPTRRVVMTEREYV